MVKVFKVVFSLIVIGIWLVLAYACTYRAAEEISFWRAMGGGM